VYQGAISILHRLQILIDNSIPRKWTFTSSLEDKEHAISKKLMCEILPAGK
jgi:hypothetical protein